ncbi:reverse transcriptase domain-containing protein [Tanacetum coccineum]
MGRSGKEDAYLQAFNDAILVEERFLMQKVKVEWLKLGDANTTYFHKVMKSQASRNRINIVTTSNGDCVNGDQVPMAFIDHYTEFLGQRGVASDFNSRICDAIFCMGDNKAPGPDGYSAAFFNKTWDIISREVIKAVNEFFINGVLRKELNHTIIALIPKVTTPMRINDYRPISCCNVLYKCISRIISNRMKDSLSSLVSLNQSAFVPRRRISDNILLTQELMHNYHLDRSTPRCAFKVDILKAYDTVDWKFLKDVLIGFGFHPRMIGWIMKCVTVTSFSLRINGSLHGYFKGNRGLPQGDPMSPYLFTLVMEVLTLMLHRWARESDFTYHQYCSKLNIINLFFADDLFLFDLNGSVEDCMELTEKVKRRINDWKNKSLSLAGRAQLIRSVLGSTHVYWASVFILPSSLMLELEQLMRGFLWCQGEMRRGKAKVAWEDVCLPRKEGGLDIYRAGLGLSAKVGEIIEGGTWCWPPDWISKYPDLANVWNHLKSFTGIPNIPSDLNSIVDFLIPLARMRSARSVVSKLVFAASSYFIWQERNSRLFMKTSRIKDQIINIIMSTVRLKLLTCKFKKTKNVEKIMHLWKLPTSLIGSPLLNDRLPCGLSQVLASGCSSVA